MAINTGYFARVDEKRLRGARAALLEAVTTQRFDAQTLYVFEDRALWRASVGKLGAEDTVGILDGFCIVAPGLAPPSPLSQLQSE
jgi:hypothetical protein